MYKKLGFSINIGTRQQVFDGEAYRTGGGLMQDDLMKNKRGAIVSKKQHAAAVKRFPALKKKLCAEKKTEEESPTPSPVRPTPRAEPQPSKEYNDILLSKDEFREQVVKKLKMDPSQEPAITQDKYPIYDEAVLQDDKSRAKIDKQIFAYGKRRGLVNWPKDINNDVRMAWITIKKTSFPKYRTGKFYILL